MMGLFVFGFYHRVLERKIARGSTARAEVRALSPWLLPSKHAESEHRVASRRIAYDTSARSACYSCFFMPRSIYRR